MWHEENHSKDSNWWQFGRQNLLIPLEDKKNGTTYRKIPKQSPSMYKPLQI